MTNLSAAASALKIQPQNQPSLSPIAQTIAARTQELQKQQEQLGKQNHIRQNVENLQKSLKAERISRGLRQNQLAKLAGVSPAVVSAAECKLCVSLDRLLKITAALGKEIKIN